LLSLVKALPAARNAPLATVISGTAVKVAPKVAPTSTSDLSKIARLFTAALGNEMCVNTMNGAQKTKLESSTCEKIDTELPSQQQFPTHTFWPRLQFSLTTALDSM
jgi:hypothetical protein